MQRVRLSRIRLVVVGVVAILTVPLLVDLPESTDGSVAQSPVTSESEAVNQAPATSAASTTTALVEQSVTLVTAGPTGDIAEGPLGGADAPEDFDAALAADRSLSPEVAARFDGVPRGPAAIEAAGADIGLVAAASGRSVDELIDLLESDPSVGITPFGDLQFRDELTDPDDLLGPGATRSDDDGGDAEPTAEPEMWDDYGIELLYPIEDTFDLESRPTSNRIIYLDFNSRTIDGVWASQVRFADFGNRPLYDPGAVTPAYDYDGEPGWSEVDYAAMQQIWARVAADFAAFDVNVSMGASRPSSDLYRSNASDNRYGAHVLFSQDIPKTEFCGCGGIAPALGVFDNTTSHAYNTPVFVYNAVNGNFRHTATTATHEVGHVLGLSHDGVRGDSDQYHTGVELGNELWAPVMGNAALNPIGQWSNGGYQDATNTEDDFTIISANGLSLLADVQRTGFTGAERIRGGVIDTAGLITTRTDVDGYWFRTAGGPFSVEAISGWDDHDGVTLSGTLDIGLTLHDAHGNVVAADDPPAERLSRSFARGLDASLALDLAPGAYELRVDGVGVQPTATTGYTDYGSIGQYRLRGSFVDDRTPDVGPEVIYATDFETAAADAEWRMSHSASRGKMVIANPVQTRDAGDGNGIRQLGSAHSGSRTLVTDGRGGNVGDWDVDGGWTTAETPFIDVPANANQVLVTFVYNFATSTNADGDYFRVDIGHPAGRELGVFTVTSSGRRNAAWRSVTVDLTRYAGQRIRVQFTAVDATRASLVEAQVDDVRVTAHCIAANGCFPVEPPATTTTTTTTTAAPTSTTAPAPSTSAPGTTTSSIPLSPTPPPPGAPLGNDPDDGLESVVDGDGDPDEAG